MRHLFLYLVLCSIIAPLPTMGQGYGYLDVNDIRMRVHAHGGIGSSGTGLASDGFEVPKGESTSTLYSAGLWFSAFAPDSSARVAAHFYNAGPGSDFFPGPLRDDGSATVEPEVSQNFDRVWVVSRTDILYHLAYFNCLDDPECNVETEYPLGYTVPDALIDWPALHDVEGYSAYLAPFFDRDGDGMYDPSNGDVPCILGDQAMFLVYNDKLQAHGLSGGEGLGLEVQMMPFAFTGLSPVLDQTVFIRYRVINRSPDDLTDAHVGFFNDFDIGCYNDDFLGTDPSRNLVYAYNQTDEDASCFAVQGYGTSPPAFGMVLLKGPRLDANGSDDPVSEAFPGWNGLGFGDGEVDNERMGIARSICPSCPGGYAVDPAQDLHFFNLSRGAWANGAPLTYGGGGYTTMPNAVPCRFTFPGASDPVGAGTSGQVFPPWFDGEVAQQGSDRKSIMSAGAFTMMSGSHLDLLVAYVYSRSTEGALASVAALQARTDSVRAFAATLPIWDQGDATPWNGQCADLLEVGITEHPGALTISMFPNPAGSAVLFDVPPALVGGLLMVRDATGRTVIRQRIVTGRDRVDLGALRSGMYLYEARSPAGRAVGRLIKE